LRYCEKDEVVDAVPVTLTLGGLHCTRCAPDDGAVIELVHKSLACDGLRVQAQPIIELSTGDVHAEELLVRIATDDGRLLLPETFLPAAEQHGLMPQIDRFVIERAAGLASCGRAVHVNLSATTIADRSLFGDVLAAVHRHRAEPSRITFEITETAAAADMLHAGRLARRLVACGFRIAIDDFGSGWGAFRYLRALPVSIIKIDREFVRDLSWNPKGMKLVTGIVALARALGDQTVGEGVEDERTLTLMQALGIDFAQGFHVGRPAPVELTPSVPRRRRAAPAPRWARSSPRAAPG
jgi:EAL domain-containing protein (putative c-di-GMP-specific phosphodiesterase class I)